MINTNKRAWKSVFLMFQASILKLINFGEVSEWNTESKDLDRKVSVSSMKH